jgi:hypothetical protein
MLVINICIANFLFEIWIYHEMSLYHLYHKYETIQTLLQNKGD